MAMAKAADRAYRPIFIDEWLEITGHSRAEAAEAADVDVSYIANMQGKRRQNPSAYVMLAISELLGVTVNDLFRRPPSDAALNILTGFSPGAQQILLARRRPTQ